MRKGFFVLRRSTALTAPAAAVGTAGQDRPQRLSRRLQRSDADHLRQDENDRRRRAHHRGRGLDRRRSRPGGRATSSPATTGRTDGRSSASSSATRSSPTPHRRSRSPSALRRTRRSSASSARPAARRCRSRRRRSRAAGSAFVSGSATRTSLTTDGTRRGYFFRVVPNDDQQGPQRRELHPRRRCARRAGRRSWTRRTRYSTGPSDTVQRILSARERERAARVGERGRRRPTSRRSSARIPANTQVVYVPWQLAPEGPALRPAAPRGRQDGEAVRLGRALRPGHLQDPGLVRLVLPDRPDRARSSRRTGAGPGRGESRAVRPAELRRDRRARHGRSTRRARTARRLAPRFGATSTRP